MTNFSKQMIEHHFNSADVTDAGLDSGGIVTAPWRRGCISTVTRQDMLVMYDVAVMWCLGMMSWTETGIVMGLR